MSSNSAFVCSFNRSGTSYSRSAWTARAVSSASNSSVPRASASNRSAVPAFWSACSATALACWCACSAASWAALVASAASVARRPSVCGPQRFDPWHAAPPLRPPDATHQCATGLLPSPFEPIGDILARLLALLFDLLLQIAAGFLAFAARSLFALTGRPHAGVSASARRRLLQPGRGCRRCALR